MVNPSKPVLTRREFLGTTAVAGAGLLLSGCGPDAGKQPAAAKKSTLNTLNLALIGYGEEDV